MISWRISPLVADDHSPTVTPAPARTREEGVHSRTAAAAASARATIAALAANCSRAGAAAGSTRARAKDISRIRPVCPSAARRCSPSRSGNRPCAAAADHEPAGTTAARTDRTSR